MLAVWNFYDAFLYGQNEYWTQLYTSQPYSHTSASVPLTAITKPLNYLLGWFYVFHHPPTFDFATCIFTITWLNYFLWNFHQCPHLFLLPVFHYMILAIIWLKFDVKMCIMGNGNDPPIRIPSWKFPDENHESNKWYHISLWKYRYTIILHSWKIICWKT